MNIDHPLELSTREDQPVAIIGRNLQLRGSTLGGFDEFRLPDAECQAFRITPLGAERILSRDGEQVIERIVVAPSAAAAAIEWQSPTETRTLVLPHGEAADAEAWLRNRRASAERRRETLLSLDSDDRLGETLEWAKYVLAYTPESTVSREARHALGEPHAGEEFQEADVADTAPLRAAAWTFLNDPTSAAEFVIAVAHGLLGLSPDEERGRLRIRPRLDTHENLTVHNIAVGDAAVRMTYQRTGHGRHFGFEQTSGPVPVRLIFEPVLPNLKYQPLVDGQPADLSVRPDGDTLILPVQIMLDDARSVDYLTQ